MLPPNYTRFCEKLELLYVGEIAFYHKSYANTPPDAQEEMEIYKVAGRHNLIVMMHPDVRQ